MRHFLDFLIPIGGIPSLRRYGLVFLQPTEGNLEELSLTYFMRKKELIGRSLRQSVNLVTPNSYQKHTQPPDAWIRIHLSRIAAPEGLIPHRPGRYGSYWILELCHQRPSAAFVRE
ncbi:hypothetical protein TNCV_2848101 [Trichonephila clavipes]|nr:hypothetical protein TNCV_2848101 [Trichonephila clavipes]